MLSKNLKKRIKVSSKNNISYVHFHCISNSSSSKKNKHVRFKNKKLNLPSSYKKKISKILRNEK